MKGSSWQTAGVLLAGAGSIGKRHARILRGLGILDLRVCDPLAAQRQALKAETSVTREFATYEEGLASNPDVVFICTPPAMHVPMSIAALEAGAHVFCEKPLADGFAGVDRLEQAIAATRRKFMVGFCFRYHDGLRKAKSYLDAGRIGRLVSIRCRMGEHLPTVRPDYRNLFTLKSGGAFDLTHEIDLACWFAGQPITAVKSLHGAFSDLGFEAPDVAEVLVQFGPSCVASIHLDFFSQPRYRLTELLGTNGTITVEFSTWDACKVSLYSAAAGQWAEESLHTDRDDMFRTEDREFLDAVAANQPIAIGVAEAAKSLRIVCEAMNQTPTPKAR